MLCVPPARVDVVSALAPPESAEVPRGFAPSKNVTVPDGVPAAEFTCAVKVTGEPIITLDALAESVVVVTGLVTFTAAGELVLVAYRREFPLQSSQMPLR